MARPCKENAKMRAKSEPEIIAACFDLQQVLNCPHGEISSFYYHRKLSVYNLTVYNMGNGFGSCYLWSEVIACGILPRRPGSTRSRVQDKKFPKA